MAGFTHETDRPLRCKRGQHGAHVFGEEADAAFASHIPDRDAMDRGASDLLERDGSFQDSAAHVEDKLWVLNHVRCSHSIEAVNW